MTPSLRTVSFGDADAGVWGAVADGELRFLALGAGSSTRAELESLTLEYSDEQGDWQLRGDGLELTIEPELALAGGPVEFDQRCRVRGGFTLDGHEQAVDCRGIRSSRDGRTDLRRCEAIRSVSGWFGAEDGVALLALRPRAPQGHDEDSVSATLFEHGGPVPVTEPRLSTTYAADGRPLRVSLELWLGEEPDDYPRRAAAEALGTPASCAHHGVEAQAELLRWHSRGMEGSGVYLLASLP